MIFVVHDPIYEQDVIVAVAEPSEARILRAVAKAGYLVEDLEGLRKALELDISQARTVQDRDSGAVIIRLLKFRRGHVDDVATVVHECVHAATMLFDRIGFPIRARSDEPLAYYVTFLVKAILGKLYAKT